MVLLRLAHRRSPSSAPARLDRAAAKRHQRMKPLYSHADLVAPTRETSSLKHPDVDAVLKHAMAFVLYHEIAHGIFDELEVPILGGEERTADSLATVLSLLSDRGGTALPMSAAVLNLAGAERGGTPSVGDYADDHGFDRQRAFDAICAVYGSAPAEHEDLLRGRNALPPERAELCPFDYERTVRDWRRVLARHLTHRGGLLPPSRSLGEPESTPYPLPCCFARPGEVTSPGARRERGEAALYCARRSARAGRPPLS